MSPRVPTSHVFFSLQSSPFFTIRVVLFLDNKNNQQPSSDETTTIEKQRKSEQSRQESCLSSRQYHKKTSEASRCHWKCVETIYWHSVRNIFSLIKKYFSYFFPKIVSDFMLNSSLFFTPRQLYAHINWIKEKESESFHAYEPAENRKMCNFSRGVDEWRRAERTKIRKKVSNFAMHTGSLSCCRWIMRNIFDNINDWKLVSLIMLQLK